MLGGGLGVVVDVVDVEVVVGGLVVVVVVDVEGVEVGLVLPGGPGGPGGPWTVGKVNWGTSAPAARRTSWRWRTSSVRVRLAASVRSIPSRVFWRSVPAFPRAFLASREST